MMIGRCKEQERPFGVVLIRYGQEVGPPAVPHTIGTLAQIRTAATAGDQLVIEVEGIQRFRLLDYAAEAEPYLIGTIEPIRDQPYNPAVVIPLALEVRHLFHTYFERLVRMAGRIVPHYQLPIDAEDLSYVIAAVMQQTTLLDRQGMLEITDTKDRLDTEKEMLESEIERISTSSDIFAEISSGVVPLTAQALSEYISRN